MIKAVLFDLDDTLVDTTKLAELARRNAVENMVRHGLPVDFDTAYNELLELINEYGSNFGRHFDYLLRRLDLPQNPKWIAAGVIAYHNTKFAYLRSVKNARRVLLELKREGYKVAVVTDGDPIKQWEKILRLELDEYFDDVFISDYLGVKKPHPKIFLKALRKLDVKPEEAVMVGDRLYSDIYGAKNVGMTTVWFRYGKYRDREMEYVEYADFTIERLEDLLKIIRGLNNEEKARSDTEVHAD
ncbi:hydrolase, HAD superfamily [Thermococcus kodakarensis KOD1]|uniref:Glyceraldehyde 3-phosphate phosphatase n=1 Tax=Thermococcus kodakarensis (strain ATCC BAA-918 / JCM 12380 / KOD1) TaxID=69014 RepID=Q5JG46_THEKO|nr:TIGR02253 family HAD-type hydrolase [Thermococcus kodakarensis]WCN28718.1 TIGR02253 family HAD-type hydrolase [Thermococcus kodakarensis]WCN31015.1 TIGR02253 family HAD-type hydrolase [Thermococcus kodakarensis]BAD84875.1 hydrolase, HAD superfamily [Thermococcus kodakarensis KOD1]